MDDYKPEMKNIKLFHWKQIEEFNGTEYTAKEKKLLRELWILQGGWTDFIQMVLYKSKGGHEITLIKARWYKRFNEILEYFGYELVRGESDGIDRYGEDKRYHVMYKRKEEIS